MALLDREGRFPEGWFFPDTYRYHKGMSDVDILRQAMVRMERVLDEVWEGRSDDLTIETPYEALIMASLIERETGAPEERREIAGVFKRRMETGMRLQTDPTVIYGMGERYEGRITRADLREATPYNTYVIDGMPPTPIAMPGRASLEAAVDPLPGDTFYFVSRGDGTHHFSRTLREHNNAVNRYIRNR
ncbi:putative aminodeoxychorismate lyase [Halomonas chromatireducens]|uniref:Putative aminodeoxychorismate lyase n=2 Tax=Halomonas TaxID=2745 RepID=A0A109UNJ0_9GAMM|nr:putative aminodeoxychorismate lyase [Halomonas chromatireducens]